MIHALYHYSIYWLSKTSAISLTLTLSSYSFFQPHHWKVIAKNTKQYNNTHSIPSLNILLTKNTKQYNNTHSIPSLILSCTKKPNKTVNAKPYLILSLIKNPNKTVNQVYTSFYNPLFLSLPKNPNKTVNVNPYLILSTTKNPNKLVNANLSLIISNTLLTKFIMLTC